MALAKSSLRVERGLVLVIAFVNVVLVVVAALFPEGFAVKPHVLCFLWLAGVVGVVARAIQLRLMRLTALSCCSCWLLEA